MADILCLLNSGLIKEVNKDRKTHYKRLFMQVTQEFWLRSLVPSPFSIVYRICRQVMLCFKRKPCTIRSTINFFGMYLWMF